MMLDSVRGSVRLARNEVRREREREKKKHTLSKAQGDLRFQG